MAGLPERNPGFNRLELSAKDRQGYDAYLAWCQKLGLPIGSFDSWYPVSRSINERWASLVRE